MHFNMGFYGCLLFKRPCFLNIISTNAENWKKKLTLQILGVKDRYSLIKLEVLSLVFNFQNN